MKAAQLGRGDASSAGFTRAIGGGSSKAAGGAPFAEFVGPAIVEERESTAVIGPGGKCRIDAGTTLVVEIPR